MKKFILKLVSYILPLIIIVFLIDFSLSFFLKKSNNYQGEYEVQNDIYSGKINANIAIYGNSRAWVQFDPSIIETQLNKKTYNFGVDGSTFDLQYLRNLEYLKYNKKPDIILLSIDNFAKNTSLYNYEQIIPYMLWNKNIYQYTHNLDAFNKKDYILPLTRYGNKINVFKSIGSVIKSMIYNKPIKSLRNKGYLGQSLKWDEVHFENFTKNNKPFKIFDTGNMKLLEKFINECNEKKIKLIFITPPSYVEGQKFIINQNEIINKIDSFTKIYNIPYLNFLNDSLSFNKENFYNSMHLNKEGSELFTRKLVKIIKEKKLID